MLSLLKVTFPFLDVFYNMDPGACLTRRIYIRQVHIAHVVVAVRTRAILYWQRDMTFVASLFVYV